MRTLVVVEANDGRVEKDGTLVFNAAAEARCFQHALDTSRRLFDEDIRTDVVLERLRSPDAEPASFINVFATAHERDQERIELCVTCLRSPLSTGAGA